MQAFFVPATSPTDWKQMARKTNYGFERREREKARAAKKAERQRVKQEKSDDRKDEGDSPQTAEDAVTESATETNDDNKPAGD